MRKTTLAPLIVLAFLDDEPVNGSLIKTAFSGQAIHDYSSPDDAVFALRRQTTEQVLFSSEKRRRNQHTISGSERRVFSNDVLCVNSLLCVNDRLN